MLRYGHEVPELLQDVRAKTQRAEVVDRQVEPAAFVVQAVLEVLLLPDEVVER